MDKSTRLSTLLEALTRRARAQGMNDSQWAAAAGLPKETLSRLRRRASCDLATLNVLAGAVAAKLTLADDAAGAIARDVHFPDRVDRAYEARLLALAASGSRDPDEWRGAGPSFFMAGMAVMVASMGGTDRQALLSLAEALHPGSSHPDVFSVWLRGSPIKPSRFLPMLREALRRAA
jgi:hypothetical protein